MDISKFKIIIEISDLDINGIDYDIFERKYSFRKASGAILLDKDGNMALMFVANRNFHKLPGGGVDSGESVEEGLARELLEETGCRAKVAGEVGLIVEYRNYPEEKHGLLHFSYCFVCNLVGEKGTPEFTGKELRQGFKVKWMQPDEALSTTMENASSDYTAKFISLRDQTFLEEYLNT